jgi:hypothetical protein
MFGAAEEHGEESTITRMASQRRGRMDAYTKQNVEHADSGKASRGLIFGVRGSTLSSAKRVMQGNAVRCDRSADHGVPVRAACSMRLRARGDRERKHTFS